jgi:hypothetical protein
MKCRVCRLAILCLRLRGKGSCALWLYIFCQMMRHVAAARVNCNIRPRCCNSTITTQRSRYLHTDSHLRPFYTGTRSLGPRVCLCGSSNNGMWGLFLGHCAKQAAAPSSTFADFTDSKSKLEFEHTYECEEEHFHSVLNVGQFRSSSAPDRRTLETRVGLTRRERTGIRCMLWGRRGRSVGGHKRVGSARRPPECFA